MFFHYLTFGAKQYIPKIIINLSKFYVSFEKEILKNSHCIFFLLFLIYNKEYKKNTCKYDKQRIKWHWPMSLWEKILQHIIFFLDSLSFLTMEGAWIFQFWLMMRIFFFNLPKIFIWLGKTKKVFPPINIAIKLIYYYSI